MTVSLFSSPGFLTLWKVSWVIYQFLSAFYQKEWCPAPILGPSWFPYFWLHFPFLPQSPPCICKHFFSNDELTTIFVTSRLQHVPFPPWYQLLDFPPSSPTFPVPLWIQFLHQNILATHNDEHQSSASRPNHSFPFRKSLHMINTHHTIDVSACHWGPCWTLLRDSVGTPMILCIVQLSRVDPLFN